MRSRVEFSYTESTNNPGYWTIYMSINEGGSWHPIEEMITWWEVETHYPDAVPFNLRRECND